MKKLFITIAALLGLLISISFATTIFIDYTKIYKEFAKNAKIELPSAEQSNFEVHKFPFPYLIITQIKQDSKVEIKDVKVSFSLLSMLTFNPKISSVQIGEAFINLSHEDVNLLTHGEFFSELMKKDLLSTEMNIDKLTFVESDRDIALVIKNFTSSTSGNTTNFSGAIDDFGNLNGSFVSKGNDTHLKLEIKDKEYSARLEENYKDSIFNDGKLNIETKKLLHKIVALIPGISEITNKINIDEDAVISLDIKSANDYIELENIAINSDSISGKGSAKLSKNSIDKSEVSLEFEKINIADWSKLDSNQTYVSSKSFNFSKNNMDANVSITNMQIDDKTSLNNIALQFIIKDDKLYINKFSGNITDSGKFALNGTIDQNSFRSQFDGNLSMNHRDLNDLAKYISTDYEKTNDPIPFALLTNLKFNSIDLSLQNILLKTNEFDVSGNFSTKFIGNSPRTTASLKFSKINLDENKFPFIGKSFNYAVDLLDNMKSEDYLNKFIPIRKVNSISNYDLTFDRLIFGNKTYENVNLNLGVYPGKISIDQLFIKDGSDWIDTSISLDANRIRPMFNVTIHNGYMGVNFLKPSSMLELRKKILDNFDLTKIDVIMNCSINKLYEDNFALEKILFQASNDQNLLNISKLNANLLGGRMLSSGSVLLEPYTLNFVYAFNSAHVAKIAKLLPKGAISSGGVLSANGMWSTRGDELKELLYNLYTKSDVIARNITLNSFSIDDFIEKIRSYNYPTDNLKEDLKKSILTGKTNIDSLKTNVELSKGVFTLPSLKFKTESSAAEGNMKFSIYDFNLDSNTKFTFYLSKPKYAKDSDGYIPSNITVKTTGNLFSPKKSTDPKDLDILLNTIKKRN